MFHALAFIALVSFCGATVLLAVVAAAIEIYEGVKGNQP